MGWITVMILEMIFKNCIIFVLLQTGEMEVRNPLFSEETPVTPTPDERPHVKWGITNTADWKKEKIHKNKNQQHPSPANDLRKVDIDLWTWEWMTLWANHVAVRLTSCMNCRGILPIVIIIVFVVYRQSVYHHIYLLLERNI